MSRLGPLLLGLLLWCLAGSARAERSVAVLPLDAAAGSESYAGLGRALAGMLVSDLSRAQGLRLVERQRLDALLAEITLSESGYLDPDTAQQLGQGVGAELVVLGSWSVVDTAFLMDARVVEVQSGDILSAVDAQGTVADFVSVEKEVVEELLGVLAVELSGAARRQVYAAAPTEDFEAFRVYGEGLDHAFEGRLDEARAAFEAALERDPAFEEARAEVAALASLLEREEARIQAERADATTRKWLGVLEAVPDERERARGFRHDLESRARFAVRSVALEALGRHCQRAEEMWAFLDRHDWRLPEVQGQHAATLKAAHAMGLIERPPSWDTIPFDGPGFSSMGAALFSTSRFVTGLSTDMQPGRGYELVPAELACQEPAGRPVRMAAIAAALDRHGVGGQVPDPQTYPEVTLADHLLVQEIRYQALAGGLDSAARARVETLVARMKGRGHSEFWAMNAAQGVVRLAEQAERQRLARHGLDEQTLVAVSRAVAAGGGELLDTGRPLCEVAVGLARPALVGRLAAYDEALAADQPARAELQIDGLGYGLAYLLDPGCVVGQPGRAEDPLGLLAWVRTADERTRPERAAEEPCRTALEQLPGRAEPANLAAAATPELAAQTALLALAWYHSSLVLPGCVDPGR